MITWAFQTNKQKKATILQSKDNQDRILQIMYSEKITKFSKKKVEKIILHPTKLSFQYSFQRILDMEKFRKY